MTFKIFFWRPLKFCLRLTRLKPWITFLLIVSGMYLWWTPKVPFLSLPLFILLLDPFGPLTPRRRKQSRVSWKRSRKRGWREQCGWIRNFQAFRPPFLDISIWEAVVSHAALPIQPSVGSPEPGECCHPKSGSWLNHWPIFPFFISLTGVSLGFQRDSVDHLWPGV